MDDLDKPDPTREQFERAAELAGRDDPYARRWSLIHERIAEAVTARKIGEECRDD